MTVIAIDGPAGAGKSTVARAVAAALDSVYVDTGAMYRAVALAVVEAGVDPADAVAVAALLPDLVIEADDERVMLGGRDVTDRIRLSDVTALVSTVSAHPEVRAHLAALQRALAASRDVVMEGRDIGSAVVPDAEVKVFLTASPGERAQRRWRERPEEGTLEEVARAIAARDEADASRSNSPLVQAADAVAIDTTGRSVEEIVEDIVALARKRSAS